MDPRNLSCGHTYCYKCASQLLQRGLIVCALCKAETNCLPVNLPKSYILRDLIEKTKHCLPTNNDRICIFCATKTELYCARCDAFICSACVPQHKKFPLTKNHPDPSVLGISQANKSLRSGSDTEVNTKHCPEHDLQLSLFCKNCNIVICETCRKQKHSFHRANAIKQEVVERRKYLADHFPMHDLHSESDLLQTKIQSLSSVGNSVQKRIQELQEEIEEKQSELLLVTREQESLKEKKHLIEEDIRVAQLSDEEILNQAKYMQAITKLSRGNLSVEKLHTATSDIGLQRLSSMSTIGGQETSVLKGKAQPWPKKEKSFVKQKGTYNSAFVEDVELPDGSIIPPDTEFTKKWCIKNTGTLDWPEGMTLCQVSGHDLHFTPAHVPAASVNEMVCVSISGKSPSKEGNYVCHFRICLPNESPVGRNRVWIDINVQQ